MTISVLEYSKPPRLLRRRAVRRWFVAIGTLVLLLVAGAIALPQYRKYQAEKEERRRLAPTTLIHAVHTGDIAKLRQALADGASPNTREGGISCVIPPELALVSAARNGQMEMAQILLDAGADPNVGVASLEGRPLLRQAVRQRDLELVERLIAKGANPNFKGSYHADALWLFEPGDQASKMLTLLLNAGADPNAGLSSGAGVLHLVVLLGTASDAEVLIKHGALVNHKDNEGRTPLDLCENGDIRQILLHAGAIHGTAGNPGASK